MLLIRYITMQNKVLPRNIDYYVDSRGREPFTEWLENLKDAGVRSRIRLRLDRVRLGNLGDYRSVGEGVYELKIDFGPGYRIYYGRSLDQIILLLYGGDKGSQEKDIQKAKECWRDYRRQHHAYETGN